MPPTAGGAVMATGLLSVALDTDGHATASAVLDWLALALPTAALLAYVAALAWLPALVAGEVLRPRLRFDLRRWATVFPVAMYAQAGFAVGHGWTVWFARRWLWAAVAVWAVCALASARHAMMRA